MFITRNIKARDYYFKKLNDPNKFRTKYARRKGWQFAQGINHSTEHNEWTAQSESQTLMFPFNIGHDSASSNPIRHRDFRSNYIDLKPTTVYTGFENPRSTEVMERSRSGTTQNDEVYKKIFAKIGPRINPLVFPFQLGDLVEIVTGRCKGQRGPICNINELHNYILVAGANIDNSIKGKGLPRAVLPKHIRLVNPEDNNSIIEEMEFMYDENHEIIRRCKYSHVLLPFPKADDVNCNEYNQRTFVNDGGLYITSDTDYPDGLHDMPALDVLDKLNDDYAKTLMSKDSGHLQSLEEEMMEIHGLTKTEDEKKKEKETWFY